MPAPEPVLSRLFRLEEINGADRCPTYLYRWTICQPKRPRWFWKGFGIYLHKFVGDDWSRDLHDHPKRFISIGLSGGYVERYEQLTRVADSYHGGWIYQSREFERTFMAPWVRTFPATHIHRIRLLSSGRSLSFSDVPNMQEGRRGCLRVRPRIRGLSARRTRCRVMTPRQGPFAAGCNQCRTLLVRRCAYQAWR